MIVQLEVFTFGSLKHFKVGVGSVTKIEPIYNSPITIKKGRKIIGYTVHYTGNDMKQRFTGSFGFIAEHRDN